MGGVYLRKYQLIGLKCHFHVNCFQQEPVTVCLAAVLYSMHDSLLQVDSLSCLEVIYFEGCGINSLSAAPTTPIGTKCSSAVYVSLTNGVLFHKLESPFTQQNALHFWGPMSKNPVMPMNEPNGNDSVSSQPFDSPFFHQWPVIRSNDSALLSSAWPEELGVS